MKTEVPDSLTPGRFAALLALLITVGFPQVILGWETFYLVDYGHFGYPLAFYHRESFRQAVVPLWNPYNHCGVPFLAEWNTLTLYPLSWIYLLLPMPWALGMFGLGHLYLAGLGMYGLARRWTGQSLAAAVAGTAFAFNGLMWYGLMWPSLTAGWAWMPWVLLAVELAWRRGQRYLILAAGTAALQLLTGAPEVTLQTWLAAGVMWLMALWRGEISRWTLAGRFLGVVGLAAGLAAGQLGPFFELLSHSSRNTGFGSSSLADVAAMPLTGWANYLVPLFHCLRSPQGVFFPANQTWTSSYYLGAAIVALALLAVTRVRHPRVWLLSGLAGFSLLMALGNQGLVYPWVKRLIPPLEFMRFPVKFTILTTFTLPLLAAFGLKWLREIPANHWAREWKNVRGITLGVLVAMAIIVGFAWKYPRAETDAVTTTLNAAGRALFLVLVIGVIGCLRRRLPLKLLRLLPLSVVILLWLDVYTHTANLSPTIPTATFEPDLIRRFFQWDRQLTAGVSRAMQSKESFWRMLASGSTNPELDFQARRLSLFMDLNLLDHAAKFDGLYPLDLSAFLEVFKRVYFTTNEAARLKDFLGISHVSHPSNLVDWVSRDSALPLITAGQKPVFAKPAETLDALIGDRFEPLREVYLPIDAQTVVQAKTSANTRILSARFAPHEVVANLEADAPALVTIAQTYYPSWRAYVDSRPTRLWQANYAFQALEVPSGRHEVKLRYQDDRFVGGLILSSVALMAGVLGWLYWRPRGTINGNDKTS